MTKDRVTGLLAVVVGGVYLAATFRVPVYESGDETGPRAFPFLIAALVIASGLGLLVKDARATVRDRMAWGFSADRGTWIRIVLTIAFGIAYGLVLDGLGYLVATFLFMIAVSSFINVGRHVQNLVVSASFSIISFVTFGILLQLSIPRGILAFLPF